jgi:hypothetical protein
MKLLEEYLTLLKNKDDRVIDFLESKKSKYSKNIIENSSSDKWAHESFASGVRYVGEAMIHSSSSFSTSNTFPSSYISFSSNHTTC